MVKKIVFLVLFFLFFSYTFASRYEHFFFFGGFHDFDNRMSFTVGSFPYDNSFWTYRTYAVRGKALYLYSGGNYLGPFDYGLQPYDYYIQHYTSDDEIGYIGGFGLKDNFFPCLNLGRYSLTYSGHIGFYPTPYVNCNISYTPPNWEGVNNRYGAYTLKNFGEFLFLYNPDTGSMLSYWSGLVGVYDIDAYDWSIYEIAVDVDGLYYVSFNNGPVSLVYDGGDLFYNIYTKTGIVNYKINGEFGDCSLNGLCYYISGSKIRIVAYTGDVIGFGTPDFVSIPYSITGIIYDFFSTFGNYFLAPFDLTSYSIVLYNPSNGDTLSYPRDGIDFSYDYVSNLSFLLDGNSGLTGGNVFSGTVGGVIGGISGNFPVAQDFNGSCPITGGTLSSSLSSFKIGGWSIFGFEIPSYSPFSSFVCFFNVVGWFFSPTPVSVFSISIGSGTVYGNVSSPSFSLRFGDVIAILLAFSVLFIFLIRYK